MVSGAFLLPGAPSARLSAEPAAAAAAPAGGSVAACAGLILLSLAWKPVGLIGCMQEDIVASLSSKSQVEIASMQKPRASSQAQNNDTHRDQARPDNICSRLASGAMNRLCIQEGHTWGRTPLREAFIRRSSSVSRSVRSTACHSGHALLEISRQRS